MKKIGINQLGIENHENCQGYQQKNCLPWEWAVHFIYSLRVPARPVGLMMRITMMSMNEIPSAHPDPSGA